MKASSGDLGNEKTAVLGGQNDNGEKYYLARRNNIVGRVFKSDGEFQYCDLGDSDQHPTVFYYRKPFAEAKYKCQSDDGEYEVLHVQPHSDK